MIDCAKRDSGGHPMDLEDYWLHMYVMLSRATSSRDILAHPCPRRYVLIARASSRAHKALANVLSKSGHTLEVCIVNRKPVGLPDAAVQEPEVVGGRVI